MTIAETGAKMTYVVGIFMTQKATKVVFRLLGGKATKDNIVALKRVA